MTLFLFNKISVPVTVQSTFYSSFTDIYIYRERERECEYVGTRYLVPLKSRCYSYLCFMNKETEEVREPFLNGRARN